MKALLLLASLTTLAAPLLAQKPALAQTFPTPDGPTVTIDTKAAPDLQPWVDQRLIPMVQEWYPKLIALLPGPGYKPPKTVTITFRADMPKGVAATSDNHINASTDWFRAHPNDVGALFHEMVHTIQQSRGYGDPHHPVWLIEGLADELRFYVYEPAAAAAGQPGTQPRGANIPATHAAAVHFNDSYRTTGNFLHFTATTFDPTLIADLNQALRTPAGVDDATWFKLTGHTLAQLDLAWHTSLPELSSPTP